MFLKIRITEYLMSLEDSAVHLTGALNTTFFKRLFYLQRLLVLYLLRQGFLELWKSISLPQFWPCYNFHKSLVNLDGSIPFLLLCLLNLQSVKVFVTLSEYKCLWIHLVPFHQNGIIHGYDCFLYTWKGKFFVNIKAVAIF